jgi:serine/threonine protein phosphatase 1
MKPAIVYAIGDVHGRADLLAAMLKFIKSDAGYYQSRPVIYFLGDIIDRGMRSRQAMDLVQQTLVDYPGSRLHKGNHDWYLTDIVNGAEKDDDMLDEWLAGGGVQTLHSYFPDLPPKWEALDAIKAKHSDHISMIEQAALYTQHGPFVFAHAGVLRGKPLEEQDPKVFMFIRKQFHDFVDAKAPVVLHGHNIFDHAPVVTENRISLDSGAYKSNRLTGCRINPSARDISFFAAEGAHTMVDVDDIEPTLLDRGAGTIYDRLDELFSGDLFKDL